MSALLAAASAAPDRELAAAFMQLQHHCERHFALEESLMRELHFAGYNEHSHEHRQLLAELHTMARAVARNRQSLARAWLCERLPEWFHLHVANLDGLLVSFLKQGGDPGRGAHGRLIME